MLAEKRSTETESSVRGILNLSDHVGFFAGSEGSFVLVLGGNQGDWLPRPRFRQHVRAKRCIIT